MGCGLVKRADMEGHLIANHTYTHPDLTKVTDEQVTEELSKTNEAIENAIGKTQAYFRPPYGATDDRVNALAESLGLITIGWGYGPYDWKHYEPNGLYMYGADDLYNQLMEDPYNGLIILCHDGHDETREANSAIIPAVDKAIPELQQKGFNFVTIDILLAGEITGKVNFLRYYRKIN